MCLIEKQYPRKYVVNGFVYVFPENPHYGDLPGKQYVHSGRFNPFQIICGNLKLDMVSILI
jgi:hypothetical protein